MKITTALFPLFLLSAFTTLLPFATAALVFDTDGKPVLNGGTYYILPVIRGMGGGIDLAATGNETCPLTVVQSSSELSLGLPIRISSPKKNVFVYQGLIFDLAFTSVPSCSPTPSKWTIVNGLSEEPSVKLTGYENTVNGGFKITKQASDYKLKFCPDSSDKCAVVSVYIDDDGIRRLVLAKKNPLIIQFKKVDASAA